MISDIQILITQGLTDGTEYFVFRPISNNNYKEVKFQIINGKIKENVLERLFDKEKVYIKNNILCN